MQEKREDPTITCPHCENEIPLRDIEKLLEVVTCDLCDNPFPLIKIRKCKNEECEKQFCLSCADSELNQYDYCNDCEEIECSGCEETILRDEQKTCAGKRCGTYYCEDCAADMIDDEGLCVIKCTKQRTVECDDCGCVIIKHKAALCNNFKECKRAYCQKHHNILNEERYCSDECEATGNKLDPVATPESLPYLTVEELDDSTEAEYPVVEAVPIPESEGDAPSQCLDCNKTLDQSGKRTCKKCASVFCVSCANAFSCCMKCSTRVCHHCGEHCTKCQKFYCYDCMTFKNGKCEKDRSIFDIFK